MNKFQIYLLIILSLIFLIKCDFPEDYKCTGVQQLKVGEEVVLCIHIIDHERNRDKKRLAVKVIADEYSVVSLDGIHNMYGNHHKNVEFLAQIGNVTSVFPSVSSNII